MTQFDGLSEVEARTRVRQMATLFAIREFQFYDAFAGYSSPPPANNETWRAALGGRRICRKILRIYIDEIQQWGGRSWLYVQAMGADPGDRSSEVGVAVVGQKEVDGHPLLDVVVPTGAWALQMVPRWASFAAELGFSGIHWDGLGETREMRSAKVDFPGFLRAALPIVRANGLYQTANFVDGKFWDGTLVMEAIEEANVISFPYWEVWTVPSVEDRFFAEVAPEGGGVFVCYPGRFASHVGENQNRFAVGVWPLDLVISRWQKARRHGNAYLAIGDGARLVQTEYFLDTVVISKEDVNKVRAKVFNGNLFMSTPRQTALLPAPPPAPAASVSPLRQSEPNGLAIAALLWRSPWVIAAACVGVVVLSAAALSQYTRVCIRRATQGTVALHANYEWDNR